MSTYDIFAGGTRHEPDLTKWRRWVLAFITLAFLTAGLPLKADVYYWDSDPTIFHRPPAFS